MQNNNCQPPTHYLKEQAEILQVPIQILQFHENMFLDVPTLGFQTACFWRSDQTPFTSGGMTGRLGQNVKTTQHVSDVSLCNFIPFKKPLASLSHGCIKMAQDNVPRRPKPKLHGRRVLDSWRPCQKPPETASVSATLRLRTLFGVESWLQKKML